MATAKRRRGILDVVRRGWKMRCGLPTETSETPHYVRCDARKGHRPIGQISSKLNSGNCRELERPRRHKTAGTSLSAGSASWK
ncbi:unnamed protein product [Lampetra fluviatilis]